MWADFAGVNMHTDTLNHQGRLTQRPYHCLLVSFAKKNKCKGQYSAVRYVCMWEYSACVN